MSTPRPAATGSRWRRRAAAAASGAPKSAATSRAIPTCDSASGRFGVTLTSSTSSSSPTWPARSAPTGASGDRIKIPSPASLMPSSTSLQSMPGDDTPRTSLRSSLRPPGNVAPGGAQATLPPGPGTFFAPQTTSTSSCRRPRRTRTSVSFSAPGCGRVPRTSAITTPATSRPRRSIDSTSSPTSVSCCATLSAVTPGLSSTSSRSQLNETFIGIAPGSGRRARRTTAGRRPRTSASPSASSGRTWASACAPATSRSPSRRPRSTPPATCARATARCDGRSLPPLQGHRLDRDRRRGDGPPERLPRRRLRPARRSPGSRSAWGCRAWRC